ncbi:MBL fold metallo-hydrolase [Chloroflexota bacterium]
MKLTNNLYFYPEKGMLDCNTYVIKDNLRIFIDPGAVQFLPVLIQGLQKDGIEPEAIDIINNSHLYVDHYWANEDLNGLSRAKILSNRLHKKFYDINVFETSINFGLPPVEFKEDVYLDRSKLDIGDTKLEMIHALGHYPDSICFNCRQKEFLICGDVILIRIPAGLTCPVVMLMSLSDPLKSYHNYKLSLYFPII